MTDAHLGFSRKLGAIVGNVFIPKYYDPTVDGRLEALRETRALYTLGELIDDGHITVQSGHEVGKMAYGTGRIPFVRTSDLANWETKTDPKQGVSPAVYHAYSSRQNVRANDILFVRDGTYLIGTCAMVTDADTPMLYQSHVLRLRISDTSPVSPALVLTALSSPIVKRQIRARQFTADIIDTIGNRYRELMLPVPLDRSERSRIERRAMSLVTERVQLREELRRIPYWAQGLTSSLGETPLIDEGSVEELRNLGFTLRVTALVGNVLIPKYYDPTLSEELGSLRSDYDLLSVNELVEAGLLEVATGIEVGKMAYGTGPVPFIRTSDMSNWELKGDPKQRVAESYYRALHPRTDVKPNDIFVVRDGTYLVGTSGIVGARDSRVLYCGGLYKLRSAEPDRLDPYLLLAMLNTPVVRRQMKSKQFTRDIIDTLGRRLLEVVVPIPKDAAFRHEIGSETQRIVERRAALRDEARQLAIDIEGASGLDDEERELVELAPL